MNGDFKCMKAKIPGNCFRLVFYKSITPTKFGPVATSHANVDIRSIIAAVVLSSKVKKILSNVGSLDYKVTRLD
jgi:hypothetical protein